MGFYFFNYIIIILRVFIRLLYYNNLNLLIFKVLKNLFYFISFFIKVIL